LGVYIDNQGIAQSEIYLLGDILVNGTQVNSHNPQILWNPQGTYFLIYEIDIGANESGITNIIASPVSIVGGNVSSIYVLGGDQPTNRRPNAAYSSRTNDFLVVYETSTPGVPSENIRGVVLSASTFVIHQEIVYVNRLTQNEHHPYVAYNSLENEFLAVWNNGTEPEDNTEKRSIRIGNTFNKETTNFEFRKGNVASFQAKSITRTLTQRSFVGFDSTSLQKRQDSTLHYFKATVLCASSSTGATTGVPTTGVIPTTGIATTGQVVVPTSSPITPIGGNSSSKHTNNSVVAAVASVVVIFGVLCIILVIALVYILVIRPKRKAAAIAVARFDPDRDASRG